MATAAQTSLPSTRTRPEPANSILTRGGGIFAGLVFVLIGAVWFLDSVEIINLGPRFGQIIAPLLLIVAGIYLLVTKLVRS